MRIIHKPTIYLLGRQSVDEAEIDRFLSDHDVEQWTTDSSVAGEKLVETAGRVCYMSFAKPRPGGNKAYIERLLEVAHGSVFEHTAWSFMITGVSRSFTHELVRHRAGFAYSQLSQRYVDESTADFVEPACIANNGELHEIWKAAVEQAQGAYVKLVQGLEQTFRDEPDATLRRKQARQAARSVLPNATETKIVVTANARGWRHFIEMRANEHAETEIRTVASMICKRLQKESPNIFGDYKMKQLPDGTEAVETVYRKV